MRITEVRVAFNMHPGSRAEAEALSTVLETLETGLRSLGAEVIPSVAIIDGRERVIISTNGPFGSATPAPIKRTPAGFVAVVWTERARAGV